MAENINKKINQRKNLNSLKKTLSSQKCLSVIFVAKSILLFISAKISKKIKISQRKQRMKKKKTNLSIIFSVLIVTNLYLEIAKTSTNYFVTE